MSDPTNGIRVGVNKKKKKKGKHNKHYRLCKKYQQIYIYTHSKFQTKNTPKMNKTYTFCEGENSFVF